MVNQAFPLLNGYAPSWADIQVTSTLYNGPLVAISDISALKWDDKVEVGSQKGVSGGRVTRRTVGEASREASITFYRNGWRNFVKQLMTLAPDRANQKAISLVAFDVLVQHTPPDDEEIYQVKIKGCRVLGRAGDYKEGTDPDTVEVPLSVAEIVEIIDGVEVVLI